MEKILQESLKFVHELAKTEDVVVIETTALNLYCIEREHKELIEYPNVILLNLFGNKDIEKITQKMKGILSNIDKELKITDTRHRVVNDSVELYMSIGDGECDEYIVCCMCLCNEDTHKEYRTEIDGLLVTKIEPCIVSMIKDFMSEMNEVDFADNVMFSELVRTAKLSEGVNSRDIIKVVNELAVEFDKNALYKHSSARSSVDEHNLYNFISLIVFKSDEELIWRYTHTEQGIHERYEWTEIEHNGRWKAREISNKSIVKISVRNG